ncbi:integrase core domain-containing protein [Delftia acidovorans]|uniref:integrase core domain-containing protein n=1 Tax=Delftia acidovorans TaxID=80866 RepID=UPI003D103FB6
MVQGFSCGLYSLGCAAQVHQAVSAVTNGKAERFIQSALREWAYGWTYQNSAERANALASCQHYYHRHRSHSGIVHIASMSRFKFAITS